MVISPLHLSLCSYADGSTSALELIVMDPVNPRDELLDKVGAARFTSQENLISLVVIVMTLFIHLVFTMAVHIIG